MAKGDDGFRQGRQGAFHREGGAVASAREEFLRALLAIEDLGFTWNEGGPLESLERRRDMDFQGFSKIILVAVWRVDVGRLAGDFTAVQPRDNRGFDQDSRRASCE